MSDLHEGAPYLSLVVASRNDDHGGSLLRRMQTFVNSFIAQCQRHGLSAELIIVEWNAPADRPRLAEALRWPRDLGLCQVRIIEVPAALHQRYQHAAALPLYQMIAKNVGIRRARGKFVLASNIDILFNDELMRFLAEKKLDRNRMYRIDRYDAMSDVPVEGSPEEQLAYCRTHLLRVNAREGTLPLTPDGERLDEQEPGGIQFGRGWHSVEQLFGQRFRWAEDEAELTVDCAFAETWGLRMQLEPGPSAGLNGVVLEVRDKVHGVLGSFTLRRPAILQIGLPASPGEQRTLHFSVKGGGFPVPGDSRILNFRILQSEQFALSGVASRSAIQARDLPLSRAVQRRLKTAGTIWKLWRRTKQEVRVGLPIPPALLHRMGARLDGSGLSIVLNSRAGTLGPPLKAGSGPDFLHSNACGDFTLMARERWNDLRGYPEFDLYSFNIDAIFCYAAHYAGVRQEMLEEPMRIYHIEHGSGSGWTPEGQQALFDRLTAKGIPYVDWHEVTGWAAQMRRLDSPIIFNREDWGLANHELPETNLPEAFSIAP